MSSIPPLSPVSYGLSRRLPATTVEEALPRVVAALAGEGFGVLTQIDVRATMQAKLGVEERPYRILGACHPGLAHEALCAEPGVGLLLPCNVLLVADDAGGVQVAAIDPVPLFAVVGRAEVSAPAAAVRARLERVLAAL